MGTNNCQAGIRESVVHWRYRRPAGSIRRQQLVSPRNQRFIEAKEKTLR